MSEKKFPFRLILASASPRRKLLLEKLGYAFDVVPSNVDESFDSKLMPNQVAELLAERKALEISKSYPDACVIGADTIVVLGNEILGKPNDREDAKRMLSGLSGSTHQVITGLCIVMPGGKKTTAHDTTIVTMRKITPKEIQAYLDSNEWDGKAGAYAIQETADRFVTGLKGAFDNVVGLPTEVVGKLLCRA